MPPEMGEAIMCSEDRFKKKKEQYRIMMEETLATKGTQCTGWNQGQRTPSSRGDGHTKA